MLLRKEFKEEELPIQPSSSISQSTTELTKLQAPKFLSIPFDEDKIEINQLQDIKLYPFYRKRNEKSQEIVLENRQQLHLVFNVR